MKINNMALVANENSDPVMKVTYSGGEDHQFPLTKGYQIHICNEFLRSLDLGIEIKFESYTQYAMLIMECAEALNNRRLH